MAAFGESCRHRVRNGSHSDDPTCPRWRQLSSKAAIAAPSAQRLAATLLNLPIQAHNALGTPASSTMCRSGLKSASPPCKPAGPRNIYTIGGFADAIDDRESIDEDTETDT